MKNSTDTSWDRTSDHCATAVLPCYLYSANILAMHGPMNVKCVTTVMRVTLISLLLSPKDSLHRDTNRALFAYKAAII